MISSKERIASALIHVKFAAAGYQNLKRVTMSIVQTFQKAFPAGKLVDFVQGESDGSARWSYRFSAQPEIVGVPENELTIGFGVPVEVRSGMLCFGKQVLRERGFPDLARTSNKAQLVFFTEQAFNFSGQVAHFYEGRILS